MTKEIAVGGGLVAIVDDDDFERLSAVKWQASSRKHKTIYAVHTSPKDDSGKRVKLLMHREVIGAPRGVKVDHKNRNGLDNRRENLRLATNAQNARNVSRRSDNKSGYKGVGFHRATGAWAAQIVVDGRHEHLGLFSSKEEAAAAYDAAAVRLHGDYAVINGVTAVAAKPRDLVPRGSAHCRAKIAEKDAIEMAALRRHGWPVNELARRHGVSTTQASRIVRKESWSRVLTDEALAAVEEELIGRGLIPRPRGRTIAPAATALRMEETVDAQ